jgi:spermidine synthase
LGPEVLARVSTPRGDLQLQRRGADYEIISNGVFLMATYNGDSERLLVSEALNAAAFPRRVLIGGLGVGFSLRAALGDPRPEQVTVVEIEAPLISWNRTHLAPFSDHGLANSRTRVVNADLVRWICETGEQFDAICLDIDNGPDWTVTDLNGGLYTEGGLQAIRRLLAPGGAVTYWSASRSTDFAARLEQVFGPVTEIPVPVERGEPDFVYLARKPG